MNKHMKERVGYNQRNSHPNFVNFFGHPRNGDKNGGSADDGESNEHEAEGTTWAKADAKEEVNEVADEAEVPRTRSKEQKKMIMKEQKKTVSIPTRHKKRQEETNISS